MPRHFEIELDQLRTLLIRMGSLVEEQIELGIKALMTADLSLARTVMERDHKVDEYDNAIDQQCMKIFALTQPVAVDLRLLMAGLKINNELERIGDIAVNIAERVESLQPYPQLLHKTSLQQMADEARVMVKNAIDSFVNNDPALAQTVLESDDSIDNLDRENFKMMVRIMKESADLIDPAAHILILSRHLERLADHATNISEEVIFIVNARIIKHHANDESA